MPHEPDSSAAPSTTIVQVHEKAAKKRRHFWKRLTRAIGFNHSNSNSNSNANALQTTRPRAPLETQMESSDEDEDNRNSVVAVAGAGSLARNVVAPVKNQSKVKGASINTSTYPPSTPAALSLRRQTKYNTVLDAEAEPMLGARRESLPDPMSKSTPTLVLPSGYAFSDSEDDEDDEESNVLQTQPFQQPDTPIRKQSLRKRNSGVEESVSPPPNARVESLVDLETILATPGKLIMSYQDARILSPLDTIEVLPTSRKLHSVFNGVLDDDSDEDDIEELTGLPNERNKDLFIHSTRKLRDERRPLGQRLAAAQFINKLLTQEGGRSKLSLLTRSFDD